jgi:hypothetical protein
MSRLLVRSGTPWGGWMGQESGSYQACQQLRPSVAEGERCQRGKNAIISTRLYLALAAAVPRCLYVCQIYRTVASRKPRSPLEHHSPLCLPITLHLYTAVLKQSGNLRLGFSLHSNPSARTANRYLRGPSVVNLPSCDCLGRGPPRSGPSTCIGN